MNDTTNQSGPKLDDLKRQYFGPAKQDEAAAAIDGARTICAAHKIPVAFNWKAEDGEKLPEGYGVAVIPITQRREGAGNVPVGLYVVGIPDLDLITEHTKGKAWLRDIAEAALMNKFANTVRPKDGQETPLSVPFSVDDFITRADRDQGLAFFRAIQSNYVGALNKMFQRKIMNGTMLRQVLSSAAFAVQQFPKFGQDLWEKLLEKMIAEANAKGDEPGILVNWKETRDQTAIEIADDWDMDDLNKMLGSTDDETAATDETASPPAIAPIGQPATG